MPFTLDLHVHTLYSGDNDGDPRETVEAALEKGLSGIAFTEHYSYEASEYAEGFREAYAGRLSIIRGVELSAAEGHVLVFGLNTDRLHLGGAPVREIVKIVGELGAAVVPSHPFRRGSGIGELIGKLEVVHALEGYNGCNLHPMNVMAIEAAGRMGLPFTGGSDAHSPREVGLCVTEFEEPVDESNIVEALKAGRYRGIDNRSISRSMPMP